MSHSVTKWSLIPLPPFSKPVPTPHSSKTLALLLVTNEAMQIIPVFAEEWSDDAGAYVPTSEILGYRAVARDGRAVGWGDTREEAIECVLRIMWRIQPYSQGAEGGV